jgi:hypothetical protein
MGLERTHAKLIGEGLPVVVLSLLGLRGISLSCGRVESLWVSPEAVHHHPARVQAQTQGQGLRRRLNEVGSRRGHLRVQHERRQDRPLRVILLGYRRPEQRHDALTAEFEQASGIAVQHLLAGGEHRLHAPMHRLRPQTPRQRHGIRQATTEHRHLFVFPHERRRARLPREVLELS